jgi:hypothetical protein
LQDRQIYIALDEDAKQATKHNVVRQTSKLGNLLEAQGSKVAILNWKAHQGKGLDDYIANGFDFELLIRDAQPLEIWESKVIKFESDNKWLDGLALNRWLKHQDYTPDIINNKQRFSFPEDLPVKGHLIGVDGYMGMGKTHTQLQLISQRQKKGIYAYVISPRRKLNNQTVARGFKDFQLTIYRLNDDDGTDLLPSKSITITLCPESLAKLDGYLEGMDLWIDEVETVLPQMLAGGTLKGKRQALTLEILKKAVSQCNNCYLLDAFLTDKTVSFFASLAEEKKVIKFGNIYQPERPQPAIIVDVVEDEKIKVHDKSVVSQILIGHKRPFIGTDSQTYAQALDLVFKTVGKVGFVLDSTSNNQTWLELFETKPELELRFKHLLVENNIPVGEFWADRLMSNPNNFFTILNPDYFVYTTTAESGVSVDLTDHFDCRALIVFGVIGTNSQLQLSGRLRDNLIPFYIYCPERSVIPQLDGFNAQKQELLKANIDSLFEEQRGLLGNSNLEICFDLAFKRMKKLNIFWEHGTYLAALANFEKANLRGCLIYKLRLMGYEIEYKNEESIKGMKDALKKAKQAVQENETLLLFNSKPFESLEEAEKVKKANPSAKTARRAKMTKILHNLPGINETPIWSVEFLLKCFTKDRNFYYNLNTYFLLFNPDIDCKNSDYSRYFRYTCEFIAQTTLLKDLGVTLSGLRKLGIDVLIQKLVKGLEIHSNSLEVIDCVKLARNRKDIKRLAGFRITPETEEKAENIKYIKTQLAKVGVFLKESGQKLDKGGVKRKWYSIDFDKFYSEYRLTSLKCIKKYFDIWKLEKYEANKPDWEYSAANNGERSPMITDSNQEESGTNKNYRERVTEITQGVPPVVNVDQWQQELQNRTKEEKINYVTFCLPQIVDGFTLLNDHIQVLPVVKQMVAGKAIQCVDSVKTLATEFYDALRNSRDLRRVIFDFDCVLIDDLECELIGTY